ncbi:MAG: leucine-rich repeat protein, partial [Candidatus Thiodiazotropha sp.]
IILTQNAITSYISNAFAGLEAVLEGLELEGDGTNLPPYGVITNLINLQLIHFEHFNQFSMGSSSTLGSFLQLKELKFINIKNLNNIAADTFLDTSNQPKFPALNNLVLRDISTLTTLPAGAIQELTNLTDFEISGTGIRQIYGLFFLQLTKLVNLHITHNTNLDTIASNAFDGLYNTLEFLFLGNNKLSNLNFLTSGTWTQLTQLNLQHNPLGILPSFIFSKTGQRLQYLNLDQCELTRISAPIFSGLASLHTLILSNNMINTVESAAFQNSPTLTELRLDKQKTSMTLHENSFQGIENSLEHLYIGKNTIDITLFWKLIEKLTNLFELNAPEIQLGNIPDKAFKNNENLATLDLGTNNIDSVQESSFYRLRDSLLSLSLSFNNITTISKCVFSNFTKMEQLHLDGNLLVCDCRIRWLHDWVLTRPDKFQAGFLVGSCHSPANLVGQFLHDININDLTCAADYVEPTCTDLYATTTTTSTTTTTTGPSTTSTEPPLIIPTINISFGLVTQDSINVLWTVTDKTDITGYDLEILKDNALYIHKPKLHRDAVSEEVCALDSDTVYTFCVSFYLKDVLYSDRRSCDFKKTLEAVVTSTTTTTAAAAAATTTTTKTITTTITTTISTNTSTTTTTTTTTKTISSSN